LRVEHSDLLQQTSKKEREVENNRNEKGERGPIRKRTEFAKLVDENPDVVENLSTKKKKRKVSGTKRGEPQN